MSHDEACFEAKAFDTIIGTTIGANNGNVMNMYAKIKNKKIFIYSLFQQVFWQINNLFTYAQIIHSKKCYAHSSYLVSLEMQ